MKKIVSFLLTAVLAICSFSTAAFAVSDTTAEPEMTAKTVTLEVPAYGTLEVEPEEPVDPDDPDPIWGQISFALAGGTSSSTSSFTPNENYMAYEVVATGGGGGQFSAKLIKGTSTVVCDMVGSANGNTYKMDWISVSPSTNYRIKITNNASSVMYYTITYYSWS